MKQMIILSALAGVLTLSGCSTLKDMVGKDTSGMHEIKSTSANTAPVTSRNGVLVDSTNQMTLYTYDKDSANKSDCGKVCLIAWPAFLAPSDAKVSGKFAPFQREDGTYQWAMDGKPLYFYANDSKPGDKNGDGKFDVWHVVATN